MHMSFLSQNKKIALSAISLFLLSLTSMVLFLSDLGGDYAKTDVLGAGDKAHEVHEEDVEDSYRSRLSNTELPIVVIDPEGKVVFASEDFCELIDVSCDVFTDNLFFEYVNSKDLPQFFSTQNKVLQGGDAVDGMGPYRLLKSKKEVLVLFNAALVPTSDKKVSHVALAAKDITSLAESLNMEATSEENINTWIQDLSSTVEKKKKMRSSVNKLGFLLGS